MKKFFTFFLALMATTALWASNVITYTAESKLPETTDNYRVGLHTNAFNVSISSHTFSNGTGTITFSGEVTTIGNNAFLWCSGLTSVTIPNSVTTIGELAFYGCTGLTSVTIPNSVTTIGDYAFDGCTGLTSVTIGNSVKTIGDYAFANCSGLTSITIPNSVTTIGEFAFENCIQLTSVTIPNSVTTIGENAFYYCLSLPVFDNLLYADTYLVGVVDKTLSAYTIKDGTKWIGYKAFYDCSNLTSITIPNSVTTIESFAFSGCSGLTSVTLNSNAIVGKAYTSSNNIENIFGTQVTEYIIGNSVTTIGESAFEDCTYLKTITLGKSLTDIGCNAFKGDFRVEEITSYAEVTPNVCSSTFDGLSKRYIYLYVPENSIRGYQVDPNWNGFDIRTKSADKKPIDGDNPIVTPSDQDVTITWPITDGTDTYTLTITKNGETVCVLTFNANGQLTNIAFAAPGHNGAHQSPAATLTAQGYQFTVTGLNPGTAYNYSITATDTRGKTLAEHKGNFSTTGGTDLESVHGSKPTMHKVLRNGQILLKRNNATYTLMGQKVK